MQERKRVEDIINELSQDLRKELEDLAHFIGEEKRKIKGKLKFDLAGLFLN